jgi:enoyl-CoA hydratase
MRKSFETIKVEGIDGHVVLVTLDRPQVANAINTQMGRELVEIFEGFSGDVDGARCVILTGRGSKAFCAGGDLKERHGMSDATWRRQHLVFERMLRALLGCPIPVIGAVNAPAFGGGCELAAACDFVYASSGARFALTEVTLGIMPGTGGTQNLPRAVGERRAKELILTGDVFTAEEALAWGFVNKVCAAENLLNEVLSVARRIAANAPISVRQAKQSIHRGIQMSLADGLAFEIEAYNRTIPTKDRLEGVRAFNERRKPDFRGE